MQLANGADTIAACAVDRNDRLKAELVLVGDVDHAGIDGSGCAFLPIEIGNLGLNVPLVSSLLDTWLHPKTHGLHSAAGWPAPMQISQSAGLADRP